MCCGVQSKALYKLVSRALAKKFQNGIAFKDHGFCAVYTRISKGKLWFFNDDGFRSILSFVISFRIIDEYKSKFYVTCVLSIVIE